MQQKNQGFTLIELIVVIGIIAILATLGLSTFENVSKNARDAKKKADLKDIKTALVQFIGQNGHGPTNYNPGYGVTEGDGNYEKSMQELINAGFLGTMPKSPDKQNPYRYYDYGPGNSVGAVVVTTLEAAPDTTTGIPPSCRPWAAGQNWCDQSSNKYYCLCITY